MQRLLAENSTLKRENAKLKLRIQAMLDAQRTGLPPVNLGMVKTEVNEVLEEVLASSRMKWHRKVTLLLQSEAGKRGKNHKNSRQTFESFVEELRRSPSEHTVEFPDWEKDHQWLARLSASQRQVLRGNVHQFLADSQYWEAVDAGDYRRHGSGCRRTRPTDRSPDGVLLKWAAVTMLDKSYFVPAMAGQKGLVATQEIPQFTVLTRYTGTMWTLEQYDSLYNGTNQENARDDYSMSFLTTKDDEEEVELIVDGLHGGHCALINDYRRCTKANNKHLNDTRLMNVQLVHVEVCGDPMLLAVAIKTIPAGSHLLSDYGTGYWTRANDCRIRQVATCRHLQIMKSLATGLGTPADRIGV